MMVMDGRNACGRKVSLLNVDDESTRQKAPSLFVRELPTYSKLPIHSRSSSSASLYNPGTASPNPPTPQLIHSDSSESVQRTPSPQTPTSATSSFYGSATKMPGSRHFARPPVPESKAMDPSISSPQFDPYFHGGYAQYAPQMDTQSQVPTGFSFAAPPTISATSGAPMNLYGHPLTEQSAPQPTEPAAPTLPAEAAPPAQRERKTTPARGRPSGSSTKNGQTEKNRYPCPVAARFTCHDFFTTSGHAARHAKTHTGKKDALCPDCGKAFTRKDNMTQHRRTHSNGKKGPKKDGRKGSTATAASERMTESPSTPAAELASPALQQTQPAVLQQQQQYASPQQTHTYLPYYTSPYQQQGYPHPYPPSHGYQHPQHQHTYPLPPPQPNHDSLRTLVLAAEHQSSLQTSWDQSHHSELPVRQQGQGDGQQR